MLNLADITSSFILPFFLIFNMHYKTTTKSHLTNIEKRAQKESQLWNTLHKIFFFYLKEIC